MMIKYDLCCCVILKLGGVIVVIFLFYVCGGDGEVELVSLESVVLCLVVLL